MSGGPLEILLDRLDALLAATPPPPPGDDPDALLIAFAAIARERAAVIAELTLLSQPVAHEPEVRARLAELVARDQLWMGALQWAQIKVGERIDAVRRARRYSR